MTNPVNIELSSNLAPILLGYDFNGVVDTGRFRVYPDDVIITGNTYHVEVMKYLSDHDIKARVYFPPDIRMSGNRNAVAVWKSEMIRRVGCTTFYEDDTLQAKIIEDSCPDCKIIKV